MCDPLGHTHTTRVYIACPATTSRAVCVFFLWPGFPDVRKLGVSKFRTFRKSEGTDRLLLNIDVDAELAPAFNWNVKQLFAFVVAEYETEAHPVNQASVPIHWPCFF